MKPPNKAGKPAAEAVEGKGPAGVLVAPAEFDRMQERQRLLESITAGLADAEAGRVVDTAELRRRLRARRARG
jgi:predicted transcriptional regulator